MPHFNLIQSKSLQSILKLKKDGINEGFGGCDEYGISTLPYPEILCSFFDEETQQAFYGETKIIGEQTVAIIRSKA